MPKKMSLNKLLINKSNPFIFFVQCACLMPLFFYLPIWLFIFWVLCSGFSLIHRRKAAPPSKIYLGIAWLIASAYSAYASPSFGSIDFAASLLVLTYSLKLFEMKKKRDTQVMALVSLLVMAASFLYNTNLIMLLYALISLTLVLSMLISDSHSAIMPLGEITKVTLGLLLKSFPLMLILFVVFPRLPPLWGVPSSGSTAVTGLSVSVTPGDIAHLASSSDPVFQAHFLDNKPSQSQLYWRAFALSVFDGSTWSKGTPLLNDAFDPSIDPKLLYFKYEIVVQPQDGTWLYSLDTPIPDSSSVRREDFGLVVTDVSDRVFSYQVTTYPQAPRDVVLSELEKQSFIKLPMDNSKSHELANQLRQQFDDKELRVQAVQNMFKKGGFRYSLKPPIMLGESIDEFLFTSRIGFCAHYAGAMTFLLRAMDIPARMVVGYQGGEYNAKGDFFQIRQYDAHAWVEYWLPNKGWLTIDPTNVVAPLRIQAGLGEALNEETSNSLPFFSTLSMKQFHWFNQIRHTWEASSNQWDRWLIQGQGAIQHKRLVREFLQRISDFGLRGLGWLLLLIIVVVGFVYGGKKLVNWHQSIHNELYHFERAIKPLNEVLNFELGLRQQLFEMQKRHPMVAKELAQVALIIEGSMYGPPWYEKNAKKLLLKKYLSTLRLAIQNIPKSEGKRRP